MPLTDSRVGPGTLVIGELTSVECQMSNVRLVPEHNEEDGVATLCDPEPVPETTTAWTLQGTAIQDFELPAATGFQEYCRANNKAEKPFTWTPNTNYGGTTKVQYTGTVQIRAVEIGGEVGKQITTEFSMPVKGEPVRVDGVALGIAV